MELGFADRATVEQAVRAARSPGATMAGVLVEMGAITEEQLAHARAERHGLLYVDLDAYGVDPKAANLLAPGAARQHRCVPVGFAGSRVILAVVDPADAPGAGALTGSAQRKLLPAVATAAAIDALIHRLPLPEPPAGELAAVSDAEEPTAAPEPAAADADVPEPTAEDTTASAGEEYELRARLSRAGAQLEEARVRSSEHHRELATARMELEARTVELEVLRTKLTDVESDAVAREPRRSTRRAKPVRCARRRRARSGAGACSRIASPSSRPRCSRPNGRPRSCARPSCACAGCSASPTTSPEGCAGREARIQDLLERRAATTPPKIVALRLVDHDRDQQPRIVRWSVADERGDVLHLRVPPSVGLLAVPVLPASCSPERRLDAVPPAASTPSSMSTPRGGRPREHALARPPVALDDVWLVHHAAVGDRAVCRRHLHRRDREALADRQVADRRARVLLSQRGTIPCARRELDPGRRSRSRTGGPSGEMPRPSVIADLHRADVRGLGEDVRRPRASRTAVVRLADHAVGDLDLRREVERVFGRDLCSWTRRDGEALNVEPGS